MRTSASLQSALDALPQFVLERHSLDPGVANIRNTESPH